MSPYPVAVFLHVVCSLGLFAALSLEWACVRNLRGSVTTGQAREWMTLRGSVRLLEWPTLLGLLVTGIYLNAMTGGGRPWTGVGILGLLLIAALSWLNGRRLSKVEYALSDHDLPVTSALARQLTDPLFTLSACVRTALALGIVFIMSTKPDRADALSALVIALAFGLAAGLPPLLRRAHVHGA